MWQHQYLSDKMLLNLSHHRGMIIPLPYFKKRNMELNPEYLFITVTRPGYGLAPKSATLPVNQRYGPSYVSFFQFVSDKNYIITNFN